MKKINQIIYVSALFVTSLAYAQLSPTENYVYSKTYLDYNTSNVATKTSETVQYFDGLGRPKQVVNIKASPTGKDVVTHIEYDGFGRQIKDYLPVPQSNTLNGGIVPNPLTNATQPTIYGQEKIYAEKTLENSPLDRLLEQKQVGTAWNDKPVKFQYDTNINEDYVRKYETTTTWHPTGKMTLTDVKLLQYFLPNQLYKNTVTDEDGNKTIEFKNGKGQILLVRKVISPTENADTYYVYNEYDLLAYVIPPLASAPTVEPSTVQNFYYQYRYDGNKRLVEKKIPGKAWEYMVYDKQDRLVMTQDAVIGASKQWLFTKYDKFGRPAYTGIYTSTQAYNSVGRAAEQALVDTKGSNNVTRTSIVGFTNGIMDVYYDNGTSNHPNNITKLLTVNYYDSYLIGDPFPTLVFNQTVLPSDAQQYGKSTKGMPVSKFVKNIEDDSWTKIYLYYDLKGRNVREFTSNYLGGYTNVERQLDFSGTVQQSLTQHKRLSTDPEKTIREVFTYDPQNRLLTHTHQIDSNPIEILTQNKYNELSQLESKKVGGNNATTPLQQVDYKYNIRGWMTQINDPVTLGNDLFGYKINYNQVEGLEVPNADFQDQKVKARYNANIAEVSWKTLSEENEPLKRYGYVYDSLNRLTAGFYQKAGNESGKEYFEKLEYDLNSNIKRLIRSEGILPGSTTAMMIDNLRYDYSGSKLAKVTDEQVGNSKGYPYLAAHNTIGYDLNGNIINHKDKGLAIEYNYLNLPKQTTQNAEVTNYTYRADGVKVKKIFKNLETNYLDGFQYKSTFSIESWNGEGTFHPDPNEIPILMLRIIPTTEGYYDALKEGYVYNFTDHLGNVRLSYTDTNKDGIIQPRAYECNSLSFKGGGGGGCIYPWKPGEIIDINNYYPFGLMHNYTATNRNAYQYKYNGKELQETGMYDYGWRQYAPDIARWMTPDPLIKDHDFTFNPNDIDDEDDDEVESAITTTLGNGGGIFNPDNLNPFSYGYNNPIKFDDPDGRCPTCIIGAIVGAATDYGLQVASNYLDPSVKNKWTDNISLSSIALSAAEGALTQGASAGRKFAVKGAVMIAKNVVDYNTSTGLKVETSGKNVVKNTIIDASVGAATKGLGGLAKTAKLDKIANKVNLNSNSKAKNFVQKVTGLSSRASSTVSKKVDVKGISKQLSNGIKNSTNKAVENTTNATTKKTVDKIKDKTNG